MSDLSGGKLKYKDFPSSYSRSSSAVIFGGSFDPIHSGHIQDIRSLLDIAETVYIAPTAKNPWKEIHPAPLEDRISMIKLVLEYESIPFSEEKDGTGLVLLHTPYVFACDLTSEIKASAKKQTREIKLFWAIGEDLEASATGWKNWDTEGVPFIILPILKGLSSSLTRQSKISPHPAISEYIKEKNLY